MLITHDYTWLCGVSMVKHKKEWLEIVQESGRDEKKQVGGRRSECLNTRVLIASACALPQSLRACMRIHENVQPGE